MNRFEQGHSPIGQKIQTYVPVLIFIVMLILFLKGVASVNDTTSAKQKDSLETALKQSIAQCYAVEGIYPPSLDYIIEHYGLIYDEDAFLIDYDYYGGNLLPDVTVVRKGKDVAR